MDFAWVVDALRRGLRVTRKAWVAVGTPEIANMLAAWKDKPGV